MKKLSRQVLEDGTYNNPYHVEPIALTKKETDKDFISTAFAWMGTIFVLMMEDICLIF